MFLTLYKETKYSVIYAIAIAQNVILACLKEDTNDQYCNR